MGMTAHDPQFAREQRGILRWLGFGAAPISDEGPQTEPSEDTAHIDPRERRRRQLLSDLGSFLLTHRLEVNPYTLAIAHDVITGADQRLARQIEARVAAREPVNLEWLDEVGRGSAQGEGSMP
jgi:diguanylate cyclase